MLRPFSTKIGRQLASNVKIKKKVNCAIYGSGLSASGALAIPKLVESAANSETLTTAKEAKHPKRIPFFNTENIRHISSGFGFSLFASSSKLYGAGINNLFQIGGHVANLNESRGQEYYISAKKIPIPLSDDDEILGISSGRAHSLVLTSSGVFALGDNCFGQCGIDPDISSTSIGTEKNPLKTVKIETDHRISSIHSSLDTSFIINEIGEVFAFGLNEDGQCSNEKFGIQWKPTKIIGDAGSSKIIKVTGSTDTILAVSENGQLFIWGQVEYGQAIGSSDDVQLNKSRQICESQTIGKIVSAASTSTSCVLSNENGQVFTWGAGVLGFGPKLDRLKRPVQLDQPLFDEKNVEKVFGGNSAMAAINSKHQIFVWGENRFSSLGLGHQKRQLFPFPIVLPGNVQDISLGPDHSLFLVR